MENTDKSTIELALNLLNENNKIVLSSISKDYKSKTNFYKLSSDVDVDTDLKKDLEKPLDISDLSPAEFERYRDTGKLPERFDEARKRSNPKSSDDKDKKVRPGLFGWLEKKLSDIQAKAIYDVLLARDPEKAKDLTVEIIKEMDMEQRADLLGVEYKPGYSSRSRSYNTYNSSIGRK